MGTVSVGFGRAVLGDGPAGTLLVGEASELIDLGGEFRAMDAQGLKTPVRLFQAMNGCLSRVAVDGHVAHVTMRPSGVITPAHHGLAVVTLVNGLAGCEPGVRAEVACDV
jgi:hypothetical protein